MILKHNLEDINFINLNEFIETNTKLENILLFVFFTNDENKDICGTLELYKNKEAFSFYFSENEKNQKRLLDISKLNNFDSYDKLLSLKNDFEIKEVLDLFLNCLKFIKNRNIYSNII